MLILSFEVRLKGSISKLSEAEGDGLDGSRSEVNRSNTCYAARKGRIILSNY